MFQVKEVPWAQMETKEAVAGKVRKAILAMMGQTERKELWAHVVIQATRVTVETRGKQLNRPDALLFQQAEQQNLDVSCKTQL